MRTETTIKAMNSIAAGEQPDKNVEGQAIPIHPGKAHLHPQKGWQGASARYSHGQ